MRKSIFDQLKTARSTSMPYARNNVQFPYGDPSLNTTLSSNTLPAISKVNPMGADVKLPPMEFGVKGDVGTPPTISGKSTVVPSTSNNIYDNISKKSKYLGAFETGMSLLSAAQSINASPTTVTKPRSVTLTTPKIESNVEATNALIRENLGTTVNTVLERSKELGRDPRKSTIGIIGKANEIMRRSASELGGKQQDLVNKRNLIEAETKNKETLINADIYNKHAARRDEILARDSAMRGQQLSSALSNVGGIFSRIMNDDLMINILKDQNETDALFAKARMLEAIND
jgi:hypothetical protein